MFNISPHRILDLILQIMGLGEKLSRGSKIFNLALDDGVTT